MIVCVDVDYRTAGAVAAAVAIARWEDEKATYEEVVRIARVEEYRPGEFFRRELPCILEVLARVRDVDTVVVDGYVWLAKGRAGLGARLFDALGGKTAVVGVAKTSFAGNDAAIEVVRAKSTRPLFVTAEGIDVVRAAEHVRVMHGDHRVPTVLKRVDRLARDS